MKRKKRRERIMQSNKRLKIESSKYTSSSWKLQCTSLLDEMIQCDDSTPFRYPVNLHEYPDYRDIIDCPMDLSTVKDKLETNQYSSPIDFCKDMRLIFQNSRNYNTNKRSRIYSMTIRLSAFFEEKIRSIISDWRSAVKYEEKLRNNQYVSDRRKPFSVVGQNGLSSDLLQLPSSSKKDDSSRPSSSRSGQGTSSSKHEDIHSRIRKKKKMNKVEERSKSKLNHVKKNLAKLKTNNCIANGAIKNSRVKVPIKKESSNIRSLKNVKRKSKSESEPEEKASESESSSDVSNDDDDDDEEYTDPRVDQRPKQKSSARIQQKLRPRTNHVRRSSRTAQLLKKALETKRRGRPPRLNSSPARTAAITALKRVVRTTHPTIHAISPLQTRSMKLLRTTTATAPQYRRSERVKQLPARHVQTTSEGTESDQSEAQSNNSSSSSSVSTPPNRRTSRRNAVNDHTYGRNNSSSESESQGPEQESIVLRNHRKKQSSSPAAKISPRVTRGALHDRNQPKRGNQQSPRIQTRNRGQRTVRYEESDDNDDYLYSDDDDSQEKTISISSRGRLRKLIKHGKSLFSE